MNSIKLISDETIIANYDYDNYGDVSCICLTDKRLYEIETDNNITNSSIIELDSIDSVELARTKHTKNTAAVIIIAVLFMLTGLIIAILSKAYLMLLLSGIGGIIFLVGLIVGAPSYTFDLMVHSKGITHNINVYFLTNDQANDLQRKILLAKENLKNI